ncbi:Carbon-nitrogen hydrolase [Elaphomyces granulatus]
MASNLAQCQVLVRKAAAAGVKALFLPEASDYIASSPAETVLLARSIQESEFVLGLQREAKQTRLSINVGIHEPAHGGSKVKNTLIWIGDQGEIMQRYQKMHLFDVEIKDGPVLKESMYVDFTAGDLRRKQGMEILPPFETPIGRVGLCICFDLRFPEISLALKRQNAHIISYPSAFTLPTGAAHWEVLLRARAIETQSYVVAAAQSGPHNEKRISYGHSMIVNPWGEVIARLGGDYMEPEIAIAEIDLDLITRIRTQMPLLRRTDVYPEV